MLKKFISIFCIAVFIAGVSASAYEVQINGNNVSGDIKRVFGGDKLMIELPDQDRDNIFWRAFYDPEYVEPTPVVHEIVDDNARELLIPEPISYFDEPGLVLEIADIKNSNGVKLEKDMVSGFSSRSSIVFEDVDFGEGYKSMVFRLATEMTGGIIEVYVDSPSGQLAGRFTLCNTDSLDNFDEQICEIDSTITGLHNVYIIGAKSMPNANISAIKLLKHPYRGAGMPFVTIEAENAQRSPTAVIHTRKDFPATVDNNAETNTHEQKAVQSASGKKYVYLSALTEYVEFTAPIDADVINLRYTIPKGSEGTLSMFINRADETQIELDSTYCYDYSTNFYQRSFDEKPIYVDIKKGDKIRFQKGPSNICDYYGIDLVDFEMRPAPITMPEGYLSITDFGATPNDDTYDHEAIQECLNAAKEQKKHVWFPEGLFIQNEKLIIPTNVNVMGAGLWYTELHCDRLAPGSRPWGGYVGFKFGNNITLSDMKITGVSRARMDHGIAIQGNDLKSGIGNIVRDVWFKNVSTVCGWANWDNSIFRDCRMIGIYADPIHFGDYPAVNNYAYNNFMRGNGDDGVAVVIRADYSDDEGRTANNLVARFNTISATYWGRGMSVVGGTDVIYADNIIDSVYNSGFIVTSEDLTPSISTPIDGVKFQRNTINEAGHDNHNHASIHFWLNSNPMKNVRIEANEILNGSTYGIAIDQASYTDAGGRTQINYNIINGNKEGGFRNGDASKIQPILTGNTGY